MSYYDDCDDEYSSEDDIYYHNYSVDYANQLLGGHHAVSSCLPHMRRKQRRHPSRLVRVATLDQIPIVNRREILPSLHSRAKFNYDDDTSSSSVPYTAPQLPSLEATSEEIERRATQRAQPIPQETSTNASPYPHIMSSYIASNNNNLPSENTQRPLTETELRQVQQQQEAFQQHLINMQRHLLEQSQQQQQQQQVPKSNSYEKKTNVSYHDIELDDDQARIAELIENDPYVAAAMEDFACTHGLLQGSRHRADSDYSSSQYSQHITKRHRRQYDEDQYHRPSPTSSMTSVTSKTKDSNLEFVLLRELQGIRHLMEEFLHGRNNHPTGIGTSYPSDPSPSMISRHRVPPPEPNQILYQNVVNTIREVMDQRAPSQREQQLKPSEINSKYKYSFKRKPLHPSKNPQSDVTEKSTDQQEATRRSSQIPTPPITPSTSVSSGNPNVPPAPPYELLANSSSSRSLTNQTRNLSYGNRQKQSNTYDRLLPGHYLGLYTNKYN